MKRTQAFVVAALAAVSLGAAAVSAQGFGPGTGYGPGYGYGPGMGRGMGPGAGPGFFGRGAGPAANSEAHLTALRTQLNITADQESAWQAFAAAVTQQSQEMQAFREQVSQSATTAPERHALMAQHMQTRAAGMASVGTALNGLYAVLNTDQRAVLDQQHARRGPRGRWGS